VTTAASFRPVTTTDRANMDRLYALGVVLTVGLGLTGGRTRPKLTVRGDTLPCREELKRHGFVWSKRYRTWTAFGDFNLASLLPALIEAHQESERRAQSAQCDVTYAGALGLLQLVIPRPAPVPRDVLSVEHGCEPSAEMVDGRERPTIPAKARVA